MRTAQRKNARASQSTPTTDQRILIQVAKTLRSSPDMGATAAIRAVGIQDPSTIRRLRRKFADQRITLAAQLNKKARSKMAKTLNNSREQIKTSKPEPSPVFPHPVSLEPRKHRAAAIGSEENGKASASAGNGKGHTTDRPGNASVDPTQLYRIMLMWSPVRMLLWQQAVVAETTSRFLRPLAA